MTIKITKHAQSCFEIESSESRVLIDPGKYSKEHEGIDVDGFKRVDIYVITHVHPDHFDKEYLKYIVDRDNPLVVTLEEVNIELKDITDNVKVSPPGFKHKDVIIASTKEEHGPLRNGNEPPNVEGVELKYSDTTIYHPGDSIKLGGSGDVILVPICGTVVLDPAQAKEQLLDLKPRLVIPMHYSSPNFPTSTDEFTDIMKKSGIKVKVLENGESIVV